MKQRRRIYYADSPKALMWERWRCNSASRELTPGSARPWSVTILIRNVRPHEFTTVSPLIAGPRRRSDIFTSQTVTTLLRSTAAWR